MKTKEDNLGTFMCFILRHKPGKFGIKVNEYGYCELDELVEAMNKDDKWKDITKDDVLQIAMKCKKNRYKVNGDMIRARYGHSFPVKLEVAEDRQLPETLIHGTNEGAMVFIWGEQEGLKPMRRQNVHLSETDNFAMLAAKRRKNPLLVTVDTQKALACGVEFTYVGDEVWLSTAIPYSCLAKKAL